MERCTLVECPAIFNKGDGYMKEITPEKYRCCSVVPTCPAIAKIDDKYVIIGKIVSTNDYTELDGRVGDGEIAIEVPADLINEAIQNRQL